MNAHTKTSGEDLLSRSTFTPILGPDNEVLGISELAVPTNREIGKKAMLERFDTQEPGDEIVHADGLTGKQKRLVAMPPPYDAHIVKPSKKWDAARGQMAPAPTILLDYEVMRVLFERLFPFPSHSWSIVKTCSDSEMIYATEGDRPGEETKDRPGRAFYAEAVVRLTLHLPGRDIHFDGHGIGYGALAMNKTGDVRAVSNERRSTEKGAVTDAKRDALGQIGPAFRRGFEDGDAFMAGIEAKLLEKIREANKPAIHAGAPRVPAPKARPRQEPPAQTATTDAAPSPATATQDSVPGTPEPAADTAEAAAKTPAAGPGADTLTLVDASGATLVVGRSTAGHGLADMILAGATTVAEMQALEEANPEAAAMLDPEMRSELRATLAEAVPAEPDTATPDDEIPDFGAPESAAPAGDSTPAESDAETGGTAPAVGASPTPGTEPDAEAAPMAPVVEGVRSKSGKTLLGEMCELLGHCRSGAEINALVESNGAAIRKMTPKQLQRFEDARQGRLAQV